MAGPLNVGDLFQSFEELKSKINEFCETNFVQLWMRDLRTLAAAAKRVPKKVDGVKSDLKYYDIKYCCIHGGQDFRPHGHGHRQTA